MTVITPRAGDRRRGHAHVAARFRRGADRALREDGRGKQQRLSVGESPREPRALREVLSVEAAINVSQQFLNPFGPQPVSIASATDNRYTATSYRVSPYIQGTAPGDIKYELRNDNTWTTLSGAPISTDNAFYDVWSGSRRGPRPEVRLGGRGELERGQVQRSAAADLGARAGEAHLAGRSPVASRRRRRLREQPVPVRHVQGRDLRRRLPVDADRADERRRQLRAPLLRLVVPVHLRPPHSAVGGQHLGVAQHHELSPAAAHAAAHRQRRGAPVLHVRLAHSGSRRAPRVRAAIHLGPRAARRAVERRCRSTRSRSACRRAPPAPSGCSARATASS